MIFLFIIHDYVVIRSKRKESLSKFLPQEVFNPSLLEILEKYRLKGYIDIQ